MSDKNISMISKYPSILSLRGTIANYEWGGTRFIPELLNIHNDQQRPFAELWIGTHARGAAKVLLGDTTIGLDRLIASEGNYILGNKIKDQFQGKLPYLFKILDAHKMLSIQVHPSKDQARYGFTEENMMNVPVNAKERIYKDENHKPEVHIALSDFWMLHGFRPLKEIKQTLEKIPEFHIFEISLETGNLEHLYATIMEMSQLQVDSVLAPILDRLQPLFHSGKITKDNPDFWAVQAFEQLPMYGGHIDRGIFSIYLFNLLHLKPGQGTYQEAGVPHAYLEGINVELMANSDNVIRGGLTPKHIDVPELLNTLNFKPGKPHILNGTKISETEKIYKTPAKEFQLSRIDINKSTPHKSRRKHGPDTIIVLNGVVEVIHGKEKFSFQRGNVFLAPADIFYTIQSKSRATLFKATVA